MKNKNIILNDVVLKIIESAINYKNEHSDECFETVIIGNKIANISVKEDLRYIIFKVVEHPTIYRIITTSFKIFNTDGDKYDCSLIMLENNYNTISLVSKYINKESEFYHPSLEKIYNYIIENYYDCNYNYIWHKCN